MSLDRLGQAARDADEQGGEDEEGREVHGDDRLEEEVLEEVGRVDDDEHENGGQVDGQDGVQDPPLEDDGHLDAGVDVAGVVVRQRPVGDEVLGEHRLRLHGDQVRSDLHHGRLQVPHNQVHSAHLGDLSSYRSEDQNSV